MSYLFNYLIIFMFKIKNPVTRLPHPKWLVKRISEQNNPVQQQKLKSFLINDVEECSGNIINIFTSILLIYVIYV